MVGLCGSYFLRGGVSRPRGPAFPQRGRVFLVLDSFGVGFVGILSPKKNDFFLKKGFVIIILQ